MRGTAKWHGFWHIGADLIAKGVLGQMWQIPPISTRTQGKSAIFSKYGFPCSPSWIMCRWTPQGRWGPAEHPRDTSHRFPASCCRLPICPVAHDSCTTENVSWGAIEGAVAPGWLQVGETFKQFQQGDGEVCGDITGCQVGEYEGRVGQPGLHLHQWCVWFQTDATLDPC